MELKLLWPEMPPKVLWPEMQPRLLPEMSPKMLPKVLVFGPVEAEMLEGD